MQSDFKYDPNDSDDESDARSQALRFALLQARMPRLRPGLAERVLGSIHNLEPRDGVEFRSSVRWRFSKFSAMAAALAFSGLLVFFGVNSPLKTLSEDEEWISALGTLNLSAADIPLIANLDELLEAEIDSQFNSSWLESSNP